MMKRVYLLFCLIFLIPCFVIVAQTDAERAKAFILESKRLPVAERVDRAINTIEKSTDGALVAEAVRDLGRFRQDPEKTQETLAILDRLISEKPNDSKIFHRASLARARLLAREGLKEEAWVFFRKQLTEQTGDFWHEAQQWYHDSLWETGDYGDIALDQYERRITDDPKEMHRDYAETESDFVEMIDPLRAMRSVRSEFSAMEDVFPRLPDSKRRPLAKSLAKSICLAADDRFPEALAVLDEIEQLAGSGKYAGHDESGDLPLYRAAVLFFEGRDFDSARAAFRKYMDLNRDNPDTVIVRGLILSYAMEHFVGDKGKIAELTGLLMDSELMTNEEIRKDLSHWDVASLLDMHQLSLACRGDWDESERICGELMRDYYPNTLSSADGAMTLAQNYWLHQGDPKRGEDLLRNILSEAPFDNIVPHVKRLLAEMTAQRGEYADASLLLQDVLARTGPYGKGPIVRCHKQALALQHQIEGGTTNE